MEITRKKIDAAYKVATPEQKKVLDALFGNQQKDDRPVIERVKSFGDALDELGENHPLVVDYCAYVNNVGDGRADNLPSDVVAYMRLRIIVAALNEGWEPQFVEKERRWVPWFVLYTNAELERMDDKDKANICRVVGRSSYNADAYGGVVFAHANDASSISYTHYGSRLAFRSENLAEYAGRQFIGIYCQMMGIELEEKED